MNTPEPDWSDERAVVDRLVLQARTFAGAGSFGEASARAQAEAVVARTTDVKCAMTNIGFADHGPRWRERLGEIVAPTLVLHREDDPYFPIGNGEAPPPRSRTLVSSGSIAPGTGSRPTPSRPSPTSYSRTRGLIRLIGRPSNRDWSVR